MRYSEFINKAFDLLFKPRQEEKMLQIPRTDEPWNRHFHKLDDRLLAFRNWSNRVVSKLLLWALILLGVSWVLWLVISIFQGK